jgi:hypothetical protein
MPASKVNGNIKLNGGHNIVIIGGYISVPSSAASNQQHAFIFQGQTGTVHVEGVHIDGSNGGEEDCFFLDMPNAIIQIENVRCEGIPGTAVTNHSDVIQFHSGHKEARVDRLTGNSYYQGIFIGEHDGPGAFGPIHLRNVNMSGVGDHYQTQIWMAAANHNWLMGYTIDFTNVWVMPSSKASTSPNASAASPWTMVKNGNQLTWPGVPNKIIGYVNEGIPPSDFVPTGLAGVQYVSPGYESGAPVPVPSTTAPSTSTAPSNAPVIPSAAPSGGTLPTAVPIPTAPATVPTFVCAGSTNGICPTIVPIIQPGVRLTPAPSGAQPTTAPMASTTQPLPTVPAATQAPIQNVPTVAVNPGQSTGGGQTKGLFNKLIELIMQLLEIFARYFSSK